MVHKLPYSTLDRWQRKFQHHYKKWLGLPQSAEPTVLYRKRKQFGLSFKTLIGLQNRLRTARLYLAKYSKDKQIRRLYSYMHSKELFRHGYSTSLVKYIPQSNKKLPPTLVLEKAERLVTFQKIKGNTQYSRQSLRSIPSKSKGNKIANDRTAVTKVLREVSDSSLMESVHTKDYRTQASWLPLVDKAMAEDLSWQKILNGYSERLLKFILNFCGDTFRTPSNLSKWNYHVAGKYCLCSKSKAIISNIMNFCLWVSE